MTDMENREQNQQQAPESAQAQPAPVEQRPMEQNAEHSAPQPAPQPEPIPQPAWEKPTPQLTLDPDPAPDPFQMPEPPKAPDPAQAQAAAQPNPQPVQYATYNYNFNTAPDQGGYQQQPQPGYDPNYQPPNYTAQSYQPQPQQQMHYTTPPAGYRQKSRLAAGILAFLLGSLGVHNFYLGFNTKGTIQLVVSLAGGLLTCGLATVVVAVWGLVDGVNLLSATTPKFDGNGVILRD